MKIAIDGPAAAGKTTLAKNLAEKLDFWYIDTGALFRAISVYLLRNGIIKDNRSQIIYLTKAPDLFENKITIRWTPSGKMNILIDGRKVSDKELRSPEVNMMASDIGVIPEVREMVLRKERALAYIGDIIMEGRDTTTVVLPDADLKIYLTADIGTRVTRRVNQLQQKSNEPVSYEMIRKQLLTRDYQDMNREYAPLKIADDAILVDSTGETAESILRHVSGLIEKYRKENMGGMISMKDFNRSEMHDKVLLMKTNNDNMYRYVLGIYNKHNDIFHIWKGPYMNVTEYPWENLSAYGTNPYDEIMAKATKTDIDVKCVMPKGLSIPAGAGIFASFMPLGDAIDFMLAKNLCQNEMDKVLKKAKNFEQYLVLTKSGRLCISYVGLYTNDKKEQFTMCTPEVVNHSVYHAHGVMPVDMIDYVVNLAEWESQYENRLADVDELYEDIRKMDLDYMSQADVMACIRDCMERHLRNRRAAK